MNVQWNHGTIVARRLIATEPLRSSLKNVSFAADAQQNNPIDIKSSWVIIKDGKPDPARYYTRQAWVYDLTSNQCSRETVGLVGLHIVTKTPSRPQWIWSTFEQVDNVPGTSAQAPFAFNDGTATPMPNGNPIPFPPPVTPPAPFNVARVLPVATLTQGTNTAYRTALMGQGSGVVWQFYQLVMTQWPVPGNAPANPATPAFTFPGNGATSAFANSTMETFDQKNVRGSCMACHNIVGSTAAPEQSTDFLWALQLNAFPPAAGTNASQPQFHGLAKDSANIYVRKLKELLKQMQLQAMPQQEKSK